VEIIDSKTLTYLAANANYILKRSRKSRQGDQSHTPGYDAFITYLCTILAHNGIITITTSVSPLHAARSFCPRAYSRLYSKFTWIALMNSVSGDCGGSKNASQIERTSLPAAPER